MAETMHLKKMSKTIEHSQGHFTPISLFLRSAAGLYEMSTHYSGPAMLYSAGPPAGREWYLQSATLFLEDTKGFAFEKFGSQAAITNGLEVKQIAGTNMSDPITTPLDGLTLKHNGDIASVCRQFDMYTFGSGDEGLVAQFDFAKNVVIQYPNRIAVIQNDTPGMIEMRCRIVAKEFPED